MKIYSVKSGDNLYDIASLNEVLEKDILDDNQLSGSPDLVVGQPLVIRDSFKRQITVNGYAFPYIDYDVLNATLPYLTYISSFSYGANTDGTVSLIDDKNVRDMAIGSNVAPLMVVTNMDSNGFSSDIAHAILSDESTVDYLISNILSIVKERGFAGVNVDFEYIYPEDKNLYNNFIMKLSNMLHINNYILTTALAPKVYADQPGILYEAHDYNFHGKYADYVILMTYEWGYSYGPPMAVAPLNQVERVLNYAVTEIPSEKILMGIPNYGYDWTLPYEKGIRAKSISNASAIELARSKGAPINFDNIANAPYFNYTVDGIEHVVWFEDARSISAKLNLVSKYNLGGVSYWQLSNMFNQNFIVLSDMYRVRKV